MPTRQALKATYNTTLDLLHAVAESSGVFPPLQSAVKDALRIINMVKGFSSNADDWEGLGTYIQKVLISVIELTARAGILDGDTWGKLSTLHHAVSEIATEVEAERALSWLERMQRYRRDPERIAKMKTRVSEVIGLFQLTVTTTTALDVKDTLDAVKQNSKALAHISQGISEVTQGVSVVAQNATLDKLQTVKGASWNISRACLENTRVKIIGDILAWIDAGAESSSDTQNPGATIMLLTAVAGAGKTTVAHTVARICAERKQLASSFFFDRETESRNTPIALFTTIAADLSRMDRRIADRVAMAIEKDGRLPSAPIPNQFMDLILKPCQGLKFSKPVSIVIDALDEAWDDSLLEILRDQACGLPSTFRIFLTSRLRPELGSLRDAPHVQTLELDIEGESNMKDISMFVPHKLRALAKDMGLGKDWPGEALTARLVDRAGGLFQWITTVCEYLRQYDDPTAELESLLGSTDPTTNSAEEKMDELYATILESCNWRDKVFLESYHRVMGTAIASKTPMSISAMEELHEKRPLASERTLLRLSPLLTGLNRASDRNHPVRVLHQSLRDFLVVRSKSLPQFTRFHVSETENSQKLAVLCVELLNRELKVKIPTTAYLSDDSQEQSGVPKSGDNTISEALRYACRFWPEHVCDVGGSKVIRGCLEELMDQHLVKWLEVTASHDKCRELGDVRRWVTTHIGSLDLPRFLNRYESYADACAKLRIRLQYDERHEEALIMAGEVVALYRTTSEDESTDHLSKLARSLISLDISLSEFGQKEESLAATQEALEICRRLVQKNQREYIPDLSLSLNNISECLSDVGQKRQALAAIEEAVEIRRQLVTENPAAHNHYLANSLNNLSIRLSDMGRPDEALTAIEEAVDIHRRLTLEQPVAYTPDLAMSLGNLSNRLSYLDRQEEALEAIEEAVKIRRQLTSERPVAYNPALADSLSNLSILLSDMGRQDEALAAIEEAVEISRRLAVERPGAYTPGLAQSLNNLSNCLSDMGRQSEALVAVEEAVEIRRQLVSQQPATYMTDLAHSLSNLSNRLSDVGRQIEALSAIEEGVEIRRRLAVEQPATHNRQLARDLYNLSLRLSDLGHHLDAVLAIEESSRLYRSLLPNHPSHFIPYLKEALDVYSKGLNALGREDEAAAVRNEADTLQN
ncbi:hypothetical protein RhiJN_25947 [Ceratobasidium sp. AG-Ba]|nr:hypothetical protein RhiJN_25947 [Ceratobasidium sp. AG-Ba]